MNTKAALSAALLLCAGSSMADSNPVVFPAGAQDGNDPRVAAFYVGQCEAWAREQGLTGIEKQNYVNNCQANGPAIWPVGAEASEPGGGE
jgi:hypothetical protein